MKSSKHSTSNGGTTGGPSDVDLVAPEILFEHDMKTRHDQILHASIRWEAFKGVSSLRENDIEMMRAYEKKSEEVQRTVFDKDPDAYAELFVRIFTETATDDTKKYALTLIDDAIRADENRVHTFLKLHEKKKEWPITALLRVLHGPTDVYTSFKVTQILSLLFLHNPRIEEDEIRFLLRWLADQLKKDSIEDLCIAVSALMRLLRRPEFRIYFKEEDGLNLLAGLLRTQRNSLQLVYQTIYCLWLLTYNSDIAAAVSETPIIPRVMDILKVTPKEKIQRISLALLRNCIDKGTNNTAIIDAGGVRLLDNFSLKKWGDEDIVADIEAIREAIAKDVVLLSSWDAYKKELEEGSLDWTPVHRSEKFWRENAVRFEENQNQPLKLLVTLIKESKDPKTLAVACYDIGEFVRFHPRGKNLIQALDAKVPIMNLMTHPDPAVQKEALLCVQKLMVHNWEYLSR